MGLSAGAIAGISVASALVSFIIAIPVVLCFHRWYLASKKPPPLPPHKDPWRNAREIRQCIRMIQNVLILERYNYTEIEMIDGQIVRELHWLVGDFVSHYLGGTGTDPDHPFDRSKFHRLAGGSHDDWDNLPEMSKTVRESTLCHFICRVLYQRMISDGDLTITLLPTDMVSTYRRFLTKLPHLPHGYFVNSGWPAEDRLRISTMLRQYWRTLTVYWGSERYDRLKKPGTERPGGLAKDWAPYNGYEMMDDDPRLPNLLAVEAILKDALEPFWGPRSQEHPDMGKRFEASEVQKEMRNMLTLAADVALKAFAHHEVTEFFWPPGNRREIQGPFAWGGRLECFGMRHRFMTSAAKSDPFDDVENTQIDCRPRYNDSDHIDSYYKRGGHGSLVDSLREERAERKKSKKEETVQEKEDRERKESLVAALNEYEPVYHASIQIPGWEGRTRP